MLYNNIKNYEKKPQIKKRQIVSNQLNIAKLIKKKKIKTLKSCYVAYLTKLLRIK